MLQDSHAFSGFSVKDLAKTKEFYGNVLGLDVSDHAMGLELKTAGNNPVFIYQKDNHEPATFTILNFPVESIDKTIEELGAKGVTFEQYDLGNGAVTDEKGVLRGKAANQGPDIAWFKDPSGNVLSVIED